ncbi:hypothetical protein BD414DRAFT_440834, partial [Trametes punicea]
MSDRGYINLIRHLTRSTSNLPLDTLQASIAHYLARPPVPVPGTSTPLVAAALGSPLFRPYTHAKLAALALAFRHAVHLRVGLLREEAERKPGGLLSRGVDVRAKLARWTREVREGFAGSEAVVRLACASGLLLGLEDWEADLRFKEKEAKRRGRIEEEVVIALAEVVDEYAREGSGWEKDFKRTVGTKGEEDPLALAVLFASQAQCIAPARLQALSLPTVIEVLMKTIDRSFYSGAFLAGASLSANVDAQGRLAISPTSTLARTVRSLVDSPYIASMSSLARFAARAVTVLVESRRAPGWEAISRTLSHLRSLTAEVEKDWEKCPLAKVTKEEEFSDTVTREIATATWSILKTLLFTTLMITQSVLSAVVFVPHPRSAQSASLSQQTPSPEGVALNVLHILSHLSSVMPQFGGVASTAEGGLPELKRVFYMALDVLASSQVAAERFVAELCRDNGASDKGKGLHSEDLPQSALDARKGFALACVEQLVPILSEETIQKRVHPLCLPHLWDPRYRETYESAHSVMLAIFAAHAHDGPAPKNVAQRRSSPSFVEMLVPMYARCLVENSSDGRLSTTQLCMAYAALVRSASAFGGGGGPGEQEERRGTAHGDAMAWFCVETLLDAIRDARPTSPSAPSSSSAPSFSSAPSSSSSSSSSSGSGPGSTPSPSEHLHRLHLALISTVPSVSLSLLPRLLSTVAQIVLSLPPAQDRTHADAAAESHAGTGAGVGMRDELVRALFKAILHDVGDAEKAYVIEWWDEHRDALA